MKCIPAFAKTPSPAGAFRATSLVWMGLVGTAAVWGLCPRGLQADERAVDLSRPGTSDDWVFLKEEASIRNSELVLDGLQQTGVAAFLNQPIVGDMTLTCKVLVEPQGPGVRAFGVLFHSRDSVSYQFVHVNRGSAILCWSNRDASWNELARVGVKRPEGKWLDVRLDCADSAARFYLDGKLVLSKNDVTRRTGRVGFNTSQGLVRVKDIRVQGTTARLDPPWRIVPRPKRHGTFHELPQEYRQTDVSGRLDITVTEPFIIGSRIMRPEMGAHEQPHLFKLQNGDILLVFHKDGDIHGAQRVAMRSRDNGHTWSTEPERVNRDEAIGTLSDGTVLVYDTYGFMKEEGLFCKELFRSRDGGARFEGPLLATVSMPLAAKHAFPGDIGRYRKTSAQWSADVGGNFWRTVLELDDGSLLACGTALFRGHPPQFYNHIRAVCHRSTDKGMTWQYLATIAYDPAHGFHEPVMCKCSDGSLLCVMRTKGGGHPLLQSRSRDQGQTWEPLRETGSLGVDPDLCLMTGGVLACSYGRPGNRVMFSVDGTGERWSDRLKVYEYVGGSFGYTGIVEVEPGKLLFVYDRNDVYPEYGGKRTTAIQAVYITVTRKD